MKSSPVYFYLLLSASLSTPAQAFIGFGVDSVAIANQYMMAEPPLPAVQEARAAWSLSLKPAYFDGELDDANEDGSFTESGEFNGFGLAVGFSYGLQKRLAAYFWSVANFIQGDFSGATTTGGIVAQAKDVSAGFFNLSAGLVYEVFEKNAGTTSLSVFGGPFVPIYSFSQAYSEATNGLSNGDFDMSATEVFWGVFVGVQARFQVAENWALNPYLVFADTFGGNCRGYDVETLRLSDANVNLDQTSTVDCGGNFNTDRSNASPRQIFLDTQIGGLGLNLTYIPWGLTVNVTAPLITPWIIDLFYEDPRPQVTLLSFSKDF